MKKSIISIFLIIILVGVGVYYFQRSRNGSGAISPNRPITSGASAEIDYTDAGYRPQTVRVKVGSTVNFVNSSSNLMWTASDPHPTHTTTPEFDSRKGLAKGKTYSFTFEKIGTFRYHNHLSPGHNGSVIVE